MSVQKLAQTRDPEIPVHSVEAEACVLGCMILGKDGATKARSALDESDFYRPAHRAIFRAICRLMDKRAAIDWVLVKHELTEAGELQVAGGMEYLIQASESVPSYVNADYYADIVLDLSALRRLENACLKTIETIRAPDIEPADKIAEHVAAVGRIRSGRKAWRHASEILSGLDKESPRALPMPWPKLNAMVSFGGLTRKEPHLLSGDTGQGKSLVAAQLARHWALSLGMRVAVVSLELDEDLYMRRVMKQETGFYSESDAAKRSEFEQAAWLRTSENLALSDLYVLDYSTRRRKERSTEAILADLRSMHVSVRLDAVIIDYVQLLQPWSGRGDWQDQSDNAQELKFFAKETGVCLVEVSQAKSKDGKMLTRGSQDYDDSAATKIEIARLGPGEDKKHPQGYDRLVNGKARHGVKSFAEMRFDTRTLQFLEKGDDDDAVYRGGE